MQRACMWGMIILFAKLGSTGIVGEFALAMAIALPFNRFASLQLPQLILANPEKCYPLARCLMVHWMMNSLAILFLISGIYILGLERPESQIVILVAIARAFESASEICYAFFYRCHRAHIAAMLQTIRGFVTLALVGSTYIVYGDLWIAMACMACVYAAFTCFVDLPVTRRFVKKDPDAWKQPGTTFADIRELAISSIPLGFCALLAVSYACLPRYALNAYLGIDGLGVFESLASLTLIADIVCQSLSRTSASHFAQAVAQKDKSRLLRLYGKVGLFYFAIGGGGVLLSVLFGKALLVFLYSEDYAQYGMVLAALMLTRTISFACAYDTLLLTMGRYQTLVTIWILSGAMLAWMITVMVPRYGLIGMVIAIAAGNGLRCALIHGTILRFLASDWWSNSHSESNSSQWDEENRSATSWS